MSFHNQIHFMFIQVSQVKKNSSHEGIKKA